jgi:hypothetical protein
VLRSVLRCVYLLVDCLGLPERSCYPNTGMYGPVLLVQVTMNSFENCEVMELSTLAGAMA